MSYSRLSRLRPRAEIRGGFWCLCVLLLLLYSPTALEAQRMSLSMEDVARGAYANQEVH